MKRCIGYHLWLLMLPVLALWAFAPSALAVMPTNLTELRLGGEFLIPREDDDWDFAAGVSGRLVFWNPHAPQIGLGLAVGGQSWDFNDESFTEFFSDGSSLVEGVTGDATMIPLGASLMARLPLAEATWLTLEGGFRYVVVDSSVEYSLEAFDRYGRRLDSIALDVDIDDGVVGLIGAEIDIPIGIGIALYGGAGYQFDLSKGKVKLAGEDIDYKNKLEAVQFSVGLKLEF